MALTRLDLRNLVRREVQDTGSPPLWSDTQLNDALAAAFAAYSQYFPDTLTAQVTSGADQTTIALGTAAIAVSAVIVDGVTAPQAPDAATLYEPAFRNQVSQTTVQPVMPFGVAATHGQAWAFFDGVVNFRYPLAVGRVVTVYLTAAHALPSDDLTPVSVPDVDSELIVLYACDRLIRSAHTDAVRRGAPGAWADARDDSGYLDRFHAALRMRRAHLISRTVQALQ
jgi:hypothetical protein